jgi:hypothetical protein
MNFHLAQVNIAWMHGGIEEPVMQGLATRINEIYELAERSKGFVWRLAENPPESLEPLEVDFPGFRRDRILYNMSVWESMEDLRAYTFHSDHADMIRDRHEWIQKVEGASLACWWVPAGYRPTIAESAERLRSVSKMGPTPFAFTMRQAFGPPA